MRYGGRNDFRPGFDPVGEMLLLLQHRERLPGAKKVIETIAPLVVVGALSLSGATPGNIAWPQAGVFDVRSAATSAVTVLDPGGAAKGGDVTLPIEGASERSSIAPPVSLMVVGTDSD